MPTDAQVAALVAIAREVVRTQRVYADNAASPIRCTRCGIFVGLGRGHCICIAARDVLDAIDTPPEGTPDAQD